MLCSSFHSFHLGIGSRINGITGRNYKTFSQFQLEKDSQVWLNAGQKEEVSHKMRPEESQETSYHPVSTEKAAPESMPSKLLAIRIHMATPVGDVQ